MTTPFIFDYNQFLQYYTNKSNLLVDSSPPVTYYFKSPSTSPYVTSSTKMYTNKTSPEHIVIDNTRFYVRKLNRDILFTFPQFIDGKYWDFHYHFGVNKHFTYDRSAPYSAIYFHKTVQNPISQSKRSFYCYFPDMSTIEKVEDMRCVQTRLNTMSKEFPLTGSDFKYIEEIISRPFLGIRLGGAKRRTRRTRKHVRKHCHNRSRSAKLRRL
jgi:hypothetical protein